MAVLTPQQEDFPRWYQDVLTKAKLAENGPAHPLPYRVAVGPDNLGGLGCRDSGVEHVLDARCALGVGEGPPGPDDQQRRQAFPPIS